MSLVSSRGPRIARPPGPQFTDTGDTKRKDLAKTTGKGEGSLLRLRSLLTPTHVHTCALGNIRGENDVPIEFLFGVHGQPDLAQRPLLAQDELRVKHGDGSGSGGGVALVE